MSPIPSWSQRADTPGQEIEGAGTEDLEVDGGATVTGKGWITAYAFNGTSAANDRVTVYDGAGSTAGPVILDLLGAVASPPYVQLERPIPFSAGARIVKIGAQRLRLWFVPAE